MPKIKNPWISAPELLDRWEITPEQLKEIMSYYDLKMHDKDGGFIVPYLSKEQETDFIDHVKFKISDVLECEQQNDESNYDLSEPSTPKEAREYGMLKRAREKWDASIEASILIGMHCENLKRSGKQIKRKDLKDKLFELEFKDLPDTTIEKIWKSIPQSIRKGAGRPKL